MDNNPVLIGAGGHAKVVLDCLNGEVAGFVDDKTQEFMALYKLDDITDGSAIISFGAVEPKGLQRRQKVFESYHDKGIDFVKAIHSSAIISDETTIGKGTLIGPGAIVNSGAKIGNNVIINSGAIIEHDAVIGDGSHIAPRAVILGGAKIGSCVMVGAGAVVLPNKEVADNEMVKALTLK